MSLTILHTGCCDLSSKECTQGARLTEQRHQHAQVAAGGLFCADQCSAEQRRSPRAVVGLPAAQLRLYGRHQQAQLSLHMIASTMVALQKFTLQQIRFMLLCNIRFLQLADAACRH